MRLTERTATRGPARCRCRSSLRRGAAAHHSMHKLAIQQLTIGRRRQQQCRRQERVARLNAGRPIPRLGPLRRRQRPRRCQPVGAARRALRGASASERSTFTGTPATRRDPPPRRRAARVRPRRAQPRRCRPPGRRCSAARRPALHGRGRPRRPPPQLLDCGARRFAHPGAASAARQPPPPTPIDQVWPQRAAVGAIRSSCAPPYLRRSAPVPRRRRPPGNWDNDTPRRGAASPPPRESPRRGGPPSTPRWLLRSSTAPQQLYKRGRRGLTMTPQTLGALREGVVVQGAAAHASAAALSVTSKANARAELAVLGAAAEPIRRGS